MDAKTAKMDDYYNHLEEVWQKIANNTLTATEWMQEYELSFHFTEASRESVVYDANKRLFETMSQTDITEDEYKKCTKTMCRFTTYLNRFWVPAKRLPTLAEAAEQAWIDAHY